MSLVEREDAPCIEVFPTMHDMPRQYTAVFG